MQHINHSHTLLEATTACVTEVCAASAETGVQHRGFSLGFLEWPRKSKNDA